MNVFTFTVILHRNSHKQNSVDPDQMYSVASELGLQSFRN